jgi:hypothetical protein
MANQQDTVTPIPEPNDWCWAIEHEGHLAWYQRALMRGDFAPGSKPLPNYVLQLDGTLPDPEKPPKCGTCGKVPSVQELVPVDRHTGTRSVLTPFRLGLAEWPPPTDPETCYVCNCPEYVADGEVTLQDFARSLPGSKSGSKKKITVCSQCATHCATVGKGRK